MKEEVRSAVQLLPTKIWYAIYTMIFFLCYIKDPTKKQNYEKKYHIQVPAIKYLERLKTIRWSSLKATAFHEEGNANPLMVSPQRAYISST